MFLEISSQGLKDDETFLSPDTASLVSSTSEESITSKPNSREKLNEYLVSKNIEPVSQPWVEWEKASDSTKLSHTRRTADIFSPMPHDLTPSSCLRDTASHRQTGLVSRVFLGTYLWYTDG